VREVADVPLVNGGGSGSIDTTAAEPVVTEITAGSGLLAPALFDRYRAFRPRPAALFCLPVVRQPGDGVATLLGGGYVASGPPGRDRLPQPYLPAGLKLTALEGAGEVQTPLTGGRAGALRIGDRVYLRHAKAGELCERFNTLLLLEGDRVVDEAPTYRGEGKAFL
jgi:D-serine deaminase-like pyridoxal phosphate-dependent protein